MPRDDSGRVNGSFYGLPCSQTRSQARRFQSEFHSTHVGFVLEKKLCFTNGAVVTHGAVDTLLNKLMWGRVKNRCVDKDWLWKAATARQSRKTAVKEGMMSDEYLEEP